MEVVLKSCILCSLFIVVYNRPTINNDHRTISNCAHYDLTNNTAKRKYCGEQISNVLRQICDVHNSDEEGSDGPGNSDISICCRETCSLAFLAQFCKCVNTTALDNMIRKETPSNNQEISNTIRKGKPTSNRKVDFSSKPPIIGMDTKKTNNYSHVNQNVNINY